MREPFQVFINGVPQERGRDFELRDGALHFTRSLAHEGKLGFWRWFLGAWGIGTYNQDDSVDVRYDDREGRPQVAQGLPIEPPQGSPPSPIR